MSLLEQLCSKYPECPGVWKFFCQLTQVPRPSRSMDKAISWAISTGRSIGESTTARDAAGNVCIRIPATKGLEHRPGIVLQAHLDMVATASPGTVHNFSSDPITAFIDGRGNLRARGTTLGADDGAGVAVALAIAESASGLRHGPISVLLTVDEEIGLVGASKLVPGELLGEDAKFLINIDFGKLGDIVLSSAGGVDRDITIPVSWAPIDGGSKCLRIGISGLRGGHTGGDIQEGRPNSIKWMSEMLLAAAGACGGNLRLVSFCGGNAHNAIPSAAEAEFVIPSEIAEPVIREAGETFDRLCLRFSHVAGSSDPRITVEGVKHPRLSNCLTSSSTRTVLHFIEAIPHGVIRWSDNIADLVETSQSLSVANLSPDGMTVEIFARSSNNETLAALPRSLEAFAELYFGGKCVAKSEDSPGWPVDTETQLCKTAATVFKQRFGVEPNLVPIHAGLECAIIMSKFPRNKMEAVSIGPNVHNGHTPEEFVELDSVVKLFDFIKGLIEELSK